MEPSKRDYKMFNRQNTLTSNQQLTMKLVNCWSFSSRQLHLIYWQTASTTFATTLPPQSVQYEYDGSQAESSNSLVTLFIPSFDKDTARMSKSFARTSTNFLLFWMLHFITRSRGQNNEYLGNILYRVYDRIQIIVSQCSVSQTEVSLLNIMNLE